MHAIKFYDKCGCETCGKYRINDNAYYFEKIEYVKNTRHSGECFLHIRRIPVF